MLGLVERKIGNIEACKKALNRSLKLNKQQPDLLNTLGILSYNSGDFPKAISFYDSALKIAPTHIDALINKGLLLNKTRRWQESESILRRALKQNPKNLTANLGLGDSLKGQRKYSEAINAYDEVLSLNPQSIIALNNKSITLKLQGNWQAAIACLETAISIAPDSSEVKHNLASALAGGGQEQNAINLYEDMLATSPEDAAAHRYLNQILWTQRSDNFLHSYRGALAKIPQDVELRRSFAGQLMQAERFQEARQEVQAAINISPENYKLRILSAKIFSEELQFENALDELTQARKLNNTDNAVLAATGEVHLGMGDGKSALKIFNKLLQRNNENLSWWALKADALRLTGSDEYHWLYDYERLLNVVKIDTPEGFSNIREFNEALLFDLEKIHRSKDHPLDQSCRFGTQTVGNIFDSDNRNIQLLKQMMSKQIREIIDKLPTDKRHPVLKNKSADFEFIGSWSVRLRKEGFHTNHNHPEGWFSGPYYVALPDIVKQKDNQQGYIKLGEPGYKSLQPLPAGRVLAPEEGTCILFPSYMWHGTVPFDSEQYRVSVSHDIVRKFA